MNTSSFLIDCLQSASTIARQQWGTVTGERKDSDPNQVLTATDIAIAQALLEKIRATYPDHNIVDEELGVVDNHSPYTWVIDPIDGTSNFAHGLPHYGIMIGLLEDGQPIAGGIALPAFDEVYLAERGSGATCNDRPVHVSTEPTLLNCLIAYGIDGHPETPSITAAETQTLGNILLAIRNLRSSNSAYDIAQVANGKYGAMLNRSSKVWDNVAQHIVIEEAGGNYTDFFGQPIDYSQALTDAERNYTYCAAAPALHQQLQRIISAS